MGYLIWRKLEGGRKHSLIPELRTLSGSSLFSPSEKRKCGVGEPEAGHLKTDPAVNETLAQETQSSHRRMRLTEVVACLKSQVSECWALHQYLSLLKVRSQGFQRHAVPGHHEPHVVRCPTGSGGMAAPGDTPSLLKIPKSQEVLGRTGGDAINAIPI